MSVVELSEILSQAEIEALLNSLGGPAGAAPGGAPASASTSGAASGGFAPPPRTTGGGSSFLPPIKSGGRTVAYEVYDFRRPDKLSKDQLRTLQMLNETFARLMGSALSAYLRTPVQIDLVALEQVPYEDYLRGINDSVFSILSLHPLNGQSVLEMEFGLVFTMIDRLLGGPGKAVSRTNLTDIERPLLRQTVERTLAALKNAWEGFMIVNPTIESTETSAQFVQIMPPTDVAVTILFEVRIGGSRHAMSLCIPYVMLKPIIPKLSAQKWFSKASRKVSPIAQEHLRHEINAAKVECTVTLGGTKMSVDEFLLLNPGDTIPLVQPTSEPITMSVGGIPKFSGRPAIQGKKLVFAVVGRAKDPNA